MNAPEAGSPTPNASLGRGGLDMVNTLNYTVDPKNFYKKFGRGVLAIIVRGMGTTILRKQDSATVCRCGCIFTVVSGMVVCGVNADTGTCFC